MGKTRTADRITRKRARREVGGADTGAACRVGESSLCHEKGRRRNALTGAGEGG